jgi:hypothetical protein
LLGSIVPAGEPEDESLRTCRAEIAAELDDETFARLRAEGAGAGRKRVLRWIRDLEPVVSV